MSQKSKDKDLLFLWPWGACQMEISIKTRLRGAGVAQPRKTVSNRLLIPVSKCRRHGKASTSIISVAGSSDRQTLKAHAVSSNSLILDARNSTRRSGT